MILLSRVYAYFFVFTRIIWAYYCHGGLRFEIVRPIVTDVGRWSNDSYRFGVSGRLFKHLLVSAGFR